MKIVLDHQCLTYDDVQLVPKYNDISSRALISLRTRLVNDVFINHPLIPANMDSIASVEMVKTANYCGGICFYHRFNHINKVIEVITKDLYDISPIGFSIGTSEVSVTYARHILERIRRLNSNGRVVFLLDVAHGHQQNVADTLKDYYKDPDLSKVPIIAGNVATREGAQFLIDHGARGIKVGIGNGSMCSTRIQTGTGVPQFTAVMEVASVLKEHNEKNNDHITLIADGGIKFPGDIVKAIGAGADSVMSGYLFAGTDATSGSIIRKGLFPNEQAFKVYRGSASRESKMDRGENGNVEGVSMEVPYRGSTKRIFAETADGIRSGISYAGFGYLYEMVGNAEFIRVSPSSIIEAFPNGLYNNRG